MCIQAGRTLQVYNSMCCGGCWMRAGDGAPQLVSCWLLFIATAAAAIDDRINTVWKSNRWLLCSSSPPLSADLKFKSDSFPQKKKKAREKRALHYLKRQISFTKSQGTVQATNPETALSVCSHLLFGSLQICRSPRRIATWFSASFILLKASSALFFCLPAIQRVCVCVCVCVEWRVWYVHCSAVSLDNGAGSHLSVCWAIRPLPQILSLCLTC